MFIHTLYDMTLIIASFFFGSKFFLSLGHISFCFQVIMRLTDKYCALLSVSKAEIQHPEF